MNYAVDIYCGVLNDSSASSFPTSIGYDLLVVKQ